MKLNARDIEIAIAKMFNYRMNVIVPNVSWGLGLRCECDLLIVSQRRYATEIEIKVSKSDIKADKKKHPAARIKAGLSEGFIMPCLIIYKTVKPCLLIAA